MQKVQFFCFLLSLLVAAYGFCGDQQPDLSASSDLQEVEHQKEELMGLLAQVDERYGEVSASLKTIEDQIKMTGLSLDKIRVEMDNYQEQINKLNTELGGQVKAAYAMGQQDKLKLMLNQQDPALSSRMMVYYDYLNKTRLVKLANLKQTVEYLDQLNKDKQKETELLAKNLDQRKFERAALEEVRKQRNGLVEQLNSEFSSKEDQLSLLKESENKLINLIQTLEHDEEEGNQAQSWWSDGDKEEKPDSFPKLDGDFSSLKGKLPLPVRGKLAAMFDGSASEANWKGVLIKAKEGSEIKAITKGKVAYAGNLKGYGLLIILEHSKEYMTLYAFNQSLYKQKGDWVEAGEVIAAVGQSGGRSEPGLYFEIRQNGKPLDPLRWCRN